MRHADADAGGKPSHSKSRSMVSNRLITRHEEATLTHTHTLTFTLALALTQVPNRFVPATEKRRDDLRWAVRSEMAWVG